MLDMLVNWLKSAFSWVIGLLPDSPFKALDMAPIQAVLPYINWIIPVNFILTVTEAWLAAVAVYYIYSVIMRWIKLI